jgi:hypothetical protein
MILNHLGTPTIITKVLTRVWVAIVRERSKNGSRGWSDAIAGWGNKPRMQVTSSMLAKARKQITL